ncbi:hypothetical protein GGI43DRAFT_416137 [Trichoderma evansii]
MTSQLDTGLRPRGPVAPWCHGPKDISAMERAKPLTNNNSMADGIAAEGVQRETIQARRQRLSRVPRACAACKIRKVRCNRDNPCSNCLTAGIACQTSYSPNENRSKPDKISQIEELVDELRDRVARIERVQSDQICPHITSEASRAEHAHPISDPKNVGTPYQGHSSFDRLSIQAVEVAQQIAGPENDDDSSNIGATIDTLQTILNRDETILSLEEYRFSRNAASRHIPTIVPLPVNVVIAMLQYIKKTPSIFLSSYAINDLLLVEDLCRRVYFPTDAISIGHVTAMHGILYFLLTEHVLLSTKLSITYNFKSLLSRCEQNLNSGLETYDVFAIPSFENIFSLVMGMIKAQEESKPLLCTTLISAAASQCQRLGYHREVTYQNEQTDRQEYMRRLFWTIYVFDKNMSLLHGHSSNIQDFEIDAQYPVLSRNAATRPWDESFIVGIKLARIQGQIYDKLYSTAAVKCSSSIRKECIDTLDAAMIELRAELEEINAGKVNYVHIFAMSRSHWDVMYYSTLTILRRGGPISGDMPRISSQCFNAARLCLQSHIRCFSMYQESGLVEENKYANWVLHCSSFTPFIAMFLHAIAGTRLEDVELLDLVVRMLQSVRNSSKGSDKLYQVCATFARLARRLVEEKNSCVGAFDAKEDSLHLDVEVHQLPLLGEEGIQEVFGEPLANSLPQWESQDLSTLLADWVNGQSSPMGTFFNNSGT